MTAGDKPPRYGCAVIGAAWLLGCATAPPPEPVHCPEPPKAWADDHQRAEDMTARAAELEKQLAALTATPNAAELIDCSWGCRLGVVTDRVKLALESMKDHEELRIMVDDRAGAEVNAEQIASLAKLPWLTDLSIHAPTLTSFGALAKLSKLKKLSLATGAISTLGFLTDLTDLEELTIDGGIGSTADLAPLRGLAKLQKLVVTSLPIRDLAPLVALSELTELNVSGDGYTDLAPLARLTKLRQLRLHGSRAADLGPLATMRDLQLLDVYGAQVRDLAPLAGLTSLAELNLAGNAALADLSPLANATALSSVDLSGTAVEKLDPLAKLPLVSLDATRTKARDLGPLGGMKSLRVLKLGSTAVSNLAPLARVTSLQILSLDDDRVADLAPLRSLTGLGELDLRGTDVQSLQPLAAVTNLRSLDVRATKVVDPGPLRGIVALWAVQLPAGVPPEKVEALERALPRAKIYRDDNTVRLDEDGKIRAPIGP